MPDCWPVLGLCWPRLNPGHCWTSTRAFCTDVPCNSLILVFPETNDPFYFELKTKNEINLLACIFHIPWVYSVPGKGPEASCKWLWPENSLVVSCITIYNLTSHYELHIHLRDVLTPGLNGVLQSVLVHHKKLYWNWVENFNSLIHNHKISNWICFHWRSHTKWRQLPLELNVLII